MPFWDYIHVGRQGRQEHHNLQDGLFQIATQTCSILVQVNNTNNISYGDNATNVQYNNFASEASCSGSTSNNRCSAQSRGGTRFDREQSIVLIPPQAKANVAHHNLSSQDGGRSSSRRSFFQHYKHRLSVSIPFTQWFAPVSHTLPPNNKTPQPCHRGNTSSNAISLECNQIRWR